MTKKNTVIAEKTKKTKTSSITTSKNSISSKLKNKSIDAEESISIISSGDSAEVIVFPANQETIPSKSLSSELNINNEDISQSEVKSNNKPTKKTNKANTGKIKLSNKKVKSNTVTSDKTVNPKTDIIDSNASVIINKIIIASTSEFDNTTKDTAQHSKFPKPIEGLLHHNTIAEDKFKPKINTLKKNSKHNNNSTNKLTDEDIIGTVEVNHLKHERIDIIDKDASKSEANNNAVVVESIKPKKIIIPPPGFDDAQKDKTPISYALEPADNTSNIVAEDRNTDNLHSKTKVKNNDGKLKDKGSNKLNAEVNDSNVISSIFRNEETNVTVHNTSALIANNNTDNIEQNKPKKIINPPLGFEEALVNKSQISETINIVAETIQPITDKNNITKLKANKKSKSKKTDKSDNKSKITDNDIIHGVNTADKNIYSKSDIVDSTSFINEENNDIITIDGNKPKKIIAPPPGFDNIGIEIKSNSKTDKKTNNPIQPTDKRRPIVNEIIIDDNTKISSAINNDSATSIETFDIQNNNSEIDTSNNLTEAKDKANKKKETDIDELHHLLNHLDTNRVTTDTKTIDVNLNNTVEQTNLSEEQHESKWSRRRKKRNEKKRLLKQHQSELQDTKATTEFSSKISEHDDNSEIISLKSPALFESLIDDVKSTKIIIPKPNIQKDNAELNTSSRYHSEKSTTIFENQSIAPLIQKSNKEQKNEQSKSHNDLKEKPLAKSTEHHASSNKSEKITPIITNDEFENELPAKKRKQPKVYTTHKNKRLDTLSESLEPTISSVEQFIKSTLFIPDEAILLLGVSGGVDSVVMLDIMASLAQRHGYQIAVAHCNHGMRGEESDADEVFVRTLASNYRAQFRAIKFDAAAHARKIHTSIENAARALRYQFFERTAKSIGARFVLSAHTADDTAETLLLNLLRGSGLTGLAGIPPRRDLVKKIHLVRPLLQLSKQQLIDYAHQRPLEWREDKSNSSNLFMRNKIRHDLLPKLREEYNPAISEILVRTTKILQGAELVVNEHVEHLVAVMTTQSTGEIRLGISFFDTLSEFLQGEIIQNIIRKLGDLPVSMATIDRIIALTKKKVQAECRVNGRITAIRDRSDIVFTNFETPDTYAQVAIGETYDAGLLMIRLTECQKKDIVYSNDGLIEYFDASLLPRQLVLRNWKPGDIIRPLGLGGSMSISDFLTNAKISVVERRKILVLCAGNEIVWVCGKRISENFKINKNTKLAVKAELIISDAEPL